MFITGMLGGHLSLMPLYGERLLNSGLGFSVVVGTTVLLLLIPVITGFRIRRRTLSAG